MAFRFFNPSVPGFPKLFLFKAGALIMLCFFLFIRDARSQGFLKTSGKEIVNDKGEAILLRGMGLGGWMLQEGYMLQLGNIGQQYKIRDSIAELIGPEKTQEFYDAWLANHTRRIDIDSMAAWGFNSVRLPMHYNLFTLSVDEEPVKGRNTWLEKGFAMTDSLLEWCRANNMYLILDLHAAPGGQGHDLNISDRNPDKPSLWESEENQQKTIALWRKLAERYAGEPWIAGYDIINEPNWGFEDLDDKLGTEEQKNGPLKKLMMEITKAIRQVDKKHIIIIEGNGFGNNYNGILPPWDDNMVLSFHKYGNFNDEASIKRFLDLREKHNVPIWLGETGENSNTWFRNAIRLMESRGIGWAWWPLKKVGFNNPLEIKLTPGYQRLLDYWHGKGTRPDPDEAYKTLMEFAENTRLENCLYNKDVIDAMFRQVNSNKTIPYKTHLIAADAVVEAVDYDLGRNNFAYFDKDTASYQFVYPPVKTTGNHGRMYRNDGVDIANYTDASGRKIYYVNTIEDGEWLQYTLNVAKGGVYALKFYTASATEGKMALSINGKALALIQVPASGTPGNWAEVPAENIRLAAGVNVLRVKAEKGGFYFKSIGFVK